MRGMTQQMILGWDFCLVHRAVMDTRAGILRLNSGSAPLLSREELAPEPGMMPCVTKHKYQPDQRNLSWGRLMVQLDGNTTS